MIRLPDATERMQGRNIRSATKSHLCKLISSKGRQTKDFSGAKLERSFSKAALSGWWQRKHHGKCRCGKLLKGVKRFTHSGIIRFSYKMSWNSCLMSLSEDDSTSADMSRFSQFWEHLFPLDSIPTEKQCNLLNSSLIYIYINIYILPVVLIIALEVLMSHCLAWNFALVCTSSTVSTVSANPEWCFCPSCKYSAANDSQ